MRLSGERLIPDGWLARLDSRAVVWTLAAILAAAAALPAVWWQQLHEDEVVVLTIAPQGLAEIVDEVFVDRGGAPLHFFVEHALLAWPGGVEGLRIPSFVFFLLALPAAGLVAERLVDRTAALVLVPTLAIAPLAVELATFGRMYSLFLAATLWATYLALVAADRGQAPLWAAAGAALGLLVYVHPIAPLYIGIALVSAVVHGWRGFRTMARTAWPAVVTVVVVGLPYHLMSLSTLKTRYDVHPLRDRLETESGDPVLDLALQRILPGGRPGQIAFSLLGIAGLVFLARKRPRSAVVLALWIVVPAAFFALLPAEGTAFFARYVLAAVPYVLLAVVVGALSLARGRLGRAGTVAAALAVLSLLATAAHRDVERLRDLAASDLRGLIAGVERVSHDGVLFSSVVSRHLDSSVALEVEGLPHIESDCRELVPYLAGPSTRRRGIWVLNGAGYELTRGLERLNARDELAVERIGSNVVLVTSLEALPPRELVALGLDVRDVWFANGETSLAARMAQHEARALAGECLTGE
jgi:dolichyl-phosphate-mannose-protein mannosyltransferase